MAETPDFIAWYQKFPRREARADAWKAWRQTEGVRPALDVLITAVARQTLELDWCRERRRFIPLPATWLRGQRWDDDFDVPEAVLPAKPLPKLDPQAALAAAAESAWAEVCAANSKGMPLLGFQDARTLPAIQAMGGIGVIRDMGERNRHYRQREFIAAFKAVQLQASPAQPGSNVVPMRRVA